MLLLPMEMKMMMLMVMTMLVLVLVLVMLMLMLQQTNRVTLTERVRRNPAWRWARLISLSNPERWKVDKQSVSDVEVDGGKGRGRCDDERIMEIGQRRELLYRTWPGVCCCCC